MKYTTYLTLSLLVIIFLSLTCTEDPAGPDISGDLKPKGSITGYVYDMWNRPLKDVLVSVNADSSVPSVSSASGLFSVGQVKEGTYVVRFTHRDYEDNPTCTVAVEQGVDDTLLTPVKLSYAYFILQGNVTVNGTPQAGAGVAVADYTEGALTGPSGSFILKHVPKNDTVTLVCAYGDVAVKTSKVAGLLENDTNDAGTINLTDKGPTVSGRVYYPDLSVAPNITVTAVAGGLQTKTGDDGYYILRNIPANEDGVIVTVNEGGFIGAAIGANAVAGAIITGCDLYLKPEPDIVNGIKLITCDVYVPYTAVTAILRVYPVTEINTVIQSYLWNVGGTPYTTSLPSCPVTVSGLSPKTTATVTAVNTFGDTSATESFSIFITGTAPVIDSIAVSKDKINYAPSTTIFEGEWAYFYLHVTDLYGGLTSMEWYFGDGATWAAPDSNPSVGHIYSSAGTYAAIFKAVDSDANIAIDTVTVTVQKPDLQSPVLLSPGSASILHIPNDSLTLQWSKTPGTGIIYNAYMTWSNNIPSENDIIASGLIDSLLKTKVDSAKTYFWRVKAIRTSDSAYAWSSIFQFTVYTNIVNNAPVFTTIPDSMTDSMYAGLSYTDTLKASDADGDFLNFSFIDSTMGMNLIDSVFSWTPTVNDTGQHTVSVKASDGKGGADTLTWAITVINGAPVIITDPVSKTVDEYDSVIFIITANGLNLSYQWQKNGVDIDSANDSVYSIDSVTCADSGMYRCVVSNLFGSSTSNPAKLTVNPYVSNIIYVKSDATGNNNGTSWTDAFTDLQKAIDTAKEDVQIWVAAGTYKPTKEQGGTGERFKSFSLKTSVAVYGGFVGTETLLSERNWLTNVTICSGDIGVVDDSLDNCYHVFFHTANMLITDKAVLDGFTVTGGNADGTAPHNNGGGMCNVLSSPTIRNCKFTKNSTNNYGGGIYNEDRSGTLLFNCTFSENYSYAGGGLCNISFSNTIVKKCSFQTNIAHFNGGGIYNECSIVTCDSTIFTSNQVLSLGVSCGGGGIYNCNKANVSIKNCFFMSNTSLSHGGGISNIGSSINIGNCTFYNNSTTGSSYNGGGVFTNNSVTLVNNCTFTGNRASWYGGGMSVENFIDILYLVNSTFTNNAANGGAGGLYLSTNASDSGDALINCILWNNFSGTVSSEIDLGGDTTLLVKNTIIKGGYTGIDSIIIDDPILGGLEDNGGFVKTCVIGVGSSAIDKGIYAYTDNNGVFISKDGSTFTDVYGNAYTPVGPVTELTATDARGVARPQGGGIDIGAFEKE